MQSIYPGIELVDEGDLLLAKLKKKSFTCSRTGKKCKK